MSIPKVIYFICTYKIICDLIICFPERVNKNTYSRNDTTTFAKSYWWLILCKFPDRSLLFSSSFLEKETFFGKTPAPLEDQARGGRSLRSATRGALTPRESAKEDLGAEVVCWTTPSSCQHTGRTQGINNGTNCCRQSRKGRG